MQNTQNKIWNTTLYLRLSMAIRRNPTASPGSESCSVTTYRRDPNFGSMR